jgi:signal transduction histidine kinase
LEPRKNESRLALIASVCFVAVSVISVIAGLGWITGRLVLAQAAPELLPMAPFAVLFFLLLTVSWSQHHWGPRSPWVRGMAVAEALLVAVLSSVIVSHFVTGAGFNIEALLLPSSETLRGYRVVEISPFAAALLLLGGVALALLFLDSRPVARSCIVLLGMVVLSAGVVMSIGYAYNAPLLYGSSLRPVAFPASIAFVFLGIGIWVSAGSDRWPIRSLVGDSVRARLMRAFLPATSLLLLFFLFLQARVIQDLAAASLIGSLELLTSLIVVILIVSRLARGIGGEIDHAIAERKKAEEMLNSSLEQLEKSQSKLSSYAEHLEDLVEERTRELKKVERLAAIGELAGMVGHDLRNPLQGISSAAHVLKEKLRSTQDETIKAMLLTIEKAVQHSDAIIRDLLEYSKEIRLEVTESDLKSLVAEALSFVTVSSKVRVLDLTVDRPRIMVDKQKITRAFVNILQNAVEAMPEGGTLTIAAGESNGNAKITFSDSGAGLTEKEIERIWEPLFTTKSKGIGLGLPICRRIIEAHGGSISVKSTPGKGSTFIVSLPRTLAAKDETL